MKKIILLTLLVLSASIMTGCDMPWDKKKEKASSSTPAITEGSNAVVNDSLSNFKRGVDEYFGSAGLPKTDDGKWIVKKVIDDGNDILTLYVDYNISGNNFILNISGSGIKAKEEKLKFTVAIAENGSVTVTPQMYNAEKAKWIIIPNMSVMTFSNIDELLRMDFNKLLFDI